MMILPSKLPKFTNKEAGYRTNFIGAAKKEDGLYETEAECLARVKDLFDVDDVDCWWDDERKGFTSEPIQNRDGMPESDGEDNSDPDDKVVEGLEAETEEVEATEDDSDVPESPESVEEESPMDDGDEELKPVPSVDGDRSYDLQASNGAQGLQAIIDKWEWDQGDEALLEKLKEETMEACDGTSEKLTLEDSVLTVVGTSADSEMITVGCIVFKWLNMHGLSVSNALKAMHLRHEEQFERYSDMQASKDDVEHDEEHSEEVVEEETTEEEN
jgi:hypothetical protein